MITGAPLAQVFAAAEADLSQARASPKMAAWSTTTQTTTHCAASPAVFDRRYLMSRRIHLLIIAALLIWLTLMAATIYLATIALHTNASADMSDLSGASISPRSAISYPAATSHRTITVTVPRGATIAVYPVAGHSISEIRWRCANARAWRPAIDWGWQVACTRIVITSKIWFTYEIRVPGRNL